MIKYEDAIRSLISDLESGLKLDSKRIELLKDELTFDTNDIEYILISVNKIGDLINKAKIEFNNYARYLVSQANQEKKKDIEIKEPVTPEVKAEETKEPVTPEVKSKSEIEKMISDNDSDWE